MNPATIAWAYVQMCWARARQLHRDERGSTSVQEVLWYVAAALGVVAVATIVWAAIRDRADDPLPEPTPP